MRQFGYMLLIVVLLAACKDKPEANPGDPIPGARAGMEAIYRGDFTAMNTYVCEEIIISLRAQISDEAAEKGGRIDLSQTTFEVSNKLKDDLLYVRITGDYAIWQGDSVDVYSTDDYGAILLLMSARDGVWQVCDIQAETAATSEPEGDG